MAVIVEPAVVCMHALIFPKVVVPDAYVHDSYLRCHSHWEEALTLEEATCALNCCNGLNNHSNIICVDAGGRKHNDQCINWKEHVRLVVCGQIEL